MEKVFKWFTKESECEKSLSYTHWFSKNFDVTNFTGIDKLLKCYIDFCSKLSVPAKMNFFESYLRTDAKRDIKKYNIKIDSMSAYDYSETSQFEEAYRILCTTGIDTYNQYLAQDISDREFKLDMNEYMSEMRSTEIQNTMMKFYPMLMDGSDVDEVQEQMDVAMKKCKTTWNSKKLNNVDIIASQKEDDSDALEFLAKTGIPCIDADIGGIYDRMVYTFTGPPGGGKTRFANAHFAYKLITEAKCDVLMYNLELSKAQVKNILIAHHIARLYANTNQPIKIPDSLMNKKNGMTEQQRRIYEAAKIDLFESGKYGNLIFKDELVVEDFEDEVIDIKRDNPNLRFVIVDYAGFAKSKPKSKYEARKQRYEIITEVYDYSVELKKQLGLGFLILNQFSDEGIQASLAGKKIRAGHIQGGQVVERHSDYDIVMTMTEEQEIVGMRTISLAKKRGTAGFNNVLISTDLSVSIFRQEAS